MDKSPDGNPIQSAFDSTTFDAEVSIHVERKVGSATISPSGRDVALASTDGLDIIDLDSPLNPPRHLRHGLPWLVADVQWSPFAVRDYWVVSTANQKALVWNLNMSEDTPQGAIEHTLHGHTRAITDINFSASHPDMLATCAVDGYVHCWDLRRPRQPIHTFIDWFAGATQVKYNRQDPHILASSHDRWLRIWDSRKGTVPIRSINAHESKIYGLDWNRTRATSIVTCSLDRSIKFWDYALDIDDPERIIRTDYPIWRARFTPFGWGVLAMPQEAPGHVHLYDTRLREGQPKDSAVKSIKTFPGHGNHKVKEFLWRSRGGVTDEGIDDREFQLVTWGEDNELRLKPVDAPTLQGVGYVKGTQLRARLNVTRKGAIYRTFRAIEKPESKPTAATGTRFMTSGIRVSALSAGMKSRSGSQGSRGLSITRPSTMKGRHKSRKGDKSRQQQIGWMSGIRISKQENGTTKRPLSRRLSLLHPEFEHEVWDEPETLQEEIIRIHEQLPKIAFDNVDMDKRIVDVSMNGPWGWGGESIYVQVTIAFPPQYPESRPAEFDIGKTSLLSVPTHDKVKEELTQIASRCMASKKGCLQPTLCYLLGEATAEASTAFLKPPSDIEQDIEDVTVESSSDEEVDNLANSSTMFSQELDSSATGDMLGNMSRNSKVPLPNRCGARFARNGRLVCFFPPQTERYKKLFDSQESDDSVRIRGESSFAAFGRLHNTQSPVPRIKTYSTVDDSRALSDASDDSDTSSSSDSDSSNYPTAPFRMTDYWRSSSRTTKHRSPTVVSQKSSAAGTGTGTNVGRVKAKPKNTVEIYDMNTFLPSKIELAKEYIIFGPGPDVCRHNARVAAKYGFQELADIWNYAGLLLNNEVPLEVFDKGEIDPVLVMAKSKAVRRQSTSSSPDSGIDMSYDKMQRPAFSGRIKWGHSPLAKELIRDLFEYYIKLADTQMLAMLSCIFSEPPSKENISDEEPKSALPRTPLSMKTPAFSLEYFPTDAAAWNTQQKGASTYCSIDSVNGLYGSDPTSYSTGETPPFRITIDHGDHQRLSDSPEMTRSLQRTNSGLGGSIVSSFARPFSISYSSSPPVAPNHPKKRPGQVESMFNSAITWGNTTVLKAVKESASIDDLTEGDEDESLIMNPPVARINVAMLNQSSFDDEGSMNTTLLDPLNNAHFERYRIAYADLLYSWKCPLARLEILKFNQLRDEYLFASLHKDTQFHAFLHSPTQSSEPRLPPPPSPIILGRRDAIRPAHYGLDVTGYCLKHESRLQPLPSTVIGGAAGRCARCKQTQKQLRCIICIEPVTGLYPACLSCGCVSHQACLENYQEQGGSTCPGACDCDCEFKASKGLVESWEALMGELGRLKAKRDERIEGWDWASTDSTMRDRSSKARGTTKEDGRRKSIGVW